MEVIFIWPSVLAIHSFAGTSSDRAPLGIAGVGLGFVSSIRFEGGGLGEEINVSSHHT